MGYSEKLSFLYKSNRFFFFCIIIHIEITIQHSLLPQLKITNFINLDLILHSIKSSLVFHEMILLQFKFDIKKNTCLWNAQLNQHELHCF